MELKDLRKVYKPDAEGDGPLMALCPVHGDANPSLAIYADGAKCFGCGRYWSARSFAESFKPQQLTIRYQSRGRRRSSDGSVKPTYIPQSLVTTYHSWLMNGRYSHRKEWFLNRGLTEETLQRLKLGHSLSGFTIPVYDVLGRLRQVRFRRDDYYYTDETGNVDESSPKYWGIAGANDPIFYLGSNLFRGGAVYLCEGELDAARLHQEGLAAVSSTNGARAITPQMVAALGQAETVYICYDQDAAGREGAGRVSALLPMAITVSWDIQLGKDVTELLKNISINDFKEMCHALRR